MTSLEEELNHLWQKAEKEFALISDLENLEKLRISYLGRKSYLANFPSFLKNLELEEKKKIGKLYNELKERINKLYLEKKNFLEQEGIKFDFDHPGLELKLGKPHLFYKTIKEIQDIFIELGFSVVDYNQIVDEKENFDYLNIPRYHPARDLWDTLWINPKFEILNHKLDSRFKNQESRMLFRTHTTVFQVPLLKKFKPPIRAIIAGKVFRYEATDRTHDFEFNQFDGISVSKKTNLAHLRYVVEKFFEKFYGAKIMIRFRPGYFPFVEPGLEIDIGCQICQQKGCIMCKKSGWIEVAGAGMIHPYVFQSAGIDYKKYQGWAFGFGIERLIMLRHGIDDIRILHSSDLRFIEQF